MEGQQHGDRLKRGLKNRHIQLIALGGAIGTGLFLGSASVIQSAGPGIILGYAIAGFIAFLIMRQLGEMVVEEPVAGSFSHFAYKYWGGFAGFASGWNYWVLYVLGGHGGTDRRWQIYPVLVAGNPYTGPRRRSSSSPSTPLT